MGKIISYRDEIAKEFSELIYTTAKTMNIADCHETAWDALAADTPKGRVNMSCLTGIELGIWSEGRIQEARKKLGLQDPQISFSSWGGHWIRLEAPDTMDTLIALRRMKEEIVPPIAAQDGAATERGAAASR